MSAYLDILPGRVGAAVLLATLLASAPATAAIYRVVDANGNVTFTDQAPPGGVSDDPAPGAGIAERIELPPPNTFVDDTPRARYEPGADSEDEGPAYTLLQITAPSNDKVIRANDGRVFIGTRVTPAVQEGHRLLLEMNGSLTGHQPVEGSIDLDNVPRGTHRIRLVVVDAADRRLIESAETVFHVQRFSRLINQQQNQRRNRPAQP